MADDARRTAARSALWMFVALLFGAFIASLAATADGRRRDDHRVYVHFTIATQPIIACTEKTMRSILLLLLGIPIPIVILIALFVH